MTKVSTGIAGLDELMAGGLPQGHVYLFRGEPGTGKTTMALQFLTDGQARGENGLYVTLSQTGEELSLVAEAYGFDIGTVAVVDADGVFASRHKDRQTVIDTGALELEHLLGTLKHQLEEVKPSRFVLDALIDLRLRALDVLAYRRLFREVMDMLLTHRTTALCIDSTPEFGGDSQIAGLVHGVVTLRRALPGYGIAQRRLEINKLRGVAHAEGLHDFTILPTGVRVFPRLSSVRDLDPPSLDTVSTGLDSLDDLLCGGVSQGTAVLIYGQTGTGKSTVASCLVEAAVRRGEAAAVFLFEEHAKTFIARAEALGLPLAEAADSGRLRSFDLRAGEVLPGEFVHKVLDEADQAQVQTVVIDSVNGYLTAAAHKDHALAQLNTLVATLRSRQVVTVLVVEQPGFLTQLSRGLDVSVLSDCMILLRQYEAQSAIRRSISVIKKRTGPHRVDLCQLVLEPGRIAITPLTEDDLAHMRSLNLMSPQAPV
ncbi:MAG: ATPase domain-containing protein [Rhodothalassiaceae bacterium]